MSVAGLTPDQLVDAAYRLRSEIADRETQLREVCEALVSRGRGDHSGTHVSRVAKVIVPAAPEPGYKLEKEKEDRAREIAGEQFSDVFTRKVSYAPCKAFGEVVAKLFTPAKAEKLLALCRVERETQIPYVKFL
jgi:hypothetical protein